MLYVDIPTPDELRRLIGVRSRWCVSIYLPTHPVTQHRDIDRLELRALAEDAVGQLTGSGVRANEVADIRDQLAELADDEAFWTYQSHGLAVFADADAIRTFRLPESVSRASEVSDRFHLSPMIAAVSFPRVGYVLALSEYAARLIEVTPDGGGEALAVPGLPERLGGLFDPQRRPGDPAIGEGGQPLAVRDNAREVDRALRTFLAGLDVPLVLATVDSLAASYRRASSYPNLAPTHISGSPDRLSDGELAARAQPILSDYNERRLQAVKEEWERRHSSGRSVADLSQIARAATLGAVDTLLYDADRPVYGTVAEADGAISVGPHGPGTYDIVDEVIGRTIMAGGRAMAVAEDDLPDRHSPVAAILRYPV